MRLAAAATHQGLSIVTPAPGKTQFFHSPSWHYCLCYCTAGPSHWGRYQSKHLNWPGAIVRTSTFGPPVSGAIKRNRGWQATHKPLTFGNRHYLGGYCRPRGAILDCGQQLHGLTTQIQTARDLACGAFNSPLGESIDVTEHVPQSPQR
jgi:hypothetical protein